MTALLLIRTYWKPIAGACIAALIAGLIAALLITRATLAGRTGERDQARQALQDQIARYRAAAEEAQAKARATDARNDQIQQETQYALESQLADARARAADYARRLSGAGTPADPGGSGGSVPATADSAGSADGASAQTVLADDLAVCSENTVKAQGWLDWWHNVSNTPSRH